MVNGVCVCCLLILGLESAVVVGFCSAFKARMFFDFSRAL